MTTALTLTLAMLLGMAPAKPQPAADAALGGAEAASVASTDLENDRPLASLAVELPARPALTGTVSGSATSAEHRILHPVSTRAFSAVPLEEVAVYVYRLADLTLRKALTDDRGAFTFRSLPAGVYKVIAHKQGFLPAVVMVKRATANAFQELQLELRPEILDEATAEEEASDFWTLRRRIPTDVLREIELAASDVSVPEPGAYSTVETRFGAEMQALSGFGGFGSMADAEMRGGAVDLRGQVGEVDMTLIGEFRQLQTSSAIGGRTGGHSSELAFQVSPTENSRLWVTGHDSQLDFGEQAAGTAPMGLQQFGVRWQGSVGPGDSEVAANYLEQQNYHRDPRLDLLGMPEATRQWNMEASFTTSLGQNSSIHTGFSYSQREPADALSATASYYRDGAPNWGTERVDLYGGAAYQASDASRLEYGVTTSVREGAMAIAPQASFAFGLGERWSAETFVRHRISDETTELPTDFRVDYYQAGRDGCGLSEADCYQLRLSRRLGERHRVSLGALHRQYGDTLRLYFSDDFFDQLESLLLLRGDELPEIEFVLEQDLGAGIQTRLSSQLAEGGGGMLTTSRNTYENAIRYLVTTLDTRFELTETGVLISFHSLNQELRAHDGATLTGDPIQRDRLRVLVTQGIGQLLGLGSGWDLTLDMQLSRASDLVTDDDDELQRRIVGGIAVRF